MVDERGEPVSAGPRVRSDERLDAGAGATALTLRRALDLLQQGPVRSSGHEAARALGRTDPVSPVTAQCTDLEYLILTREQADAWSEFDPGAPPVGVPLVGGDYGVAQTDPFREQDFTVGDANATFLEQDERQLRGALKTPLFPAAAKTILDWALLRTNGELDSCTGTLVSPGVETIRHFGLKVDKIRLEAAVRGDLVASLDLIGRHERKIAPAPARPAMPAVNGYTFAATRFLLSLDGGSTEIEPVSVEAFHLEQANKLDVGPPREDRADPERSGSASYLFAGKPDVSGSITALWDRAAYGDMARGKLPGSFRAVLAHKSGASTAVAAGGASAGTAVSVPVTSSTAFGVGEVVRFESSAGVLKCAGKVVAKADATHVSIASLEKNLVEGDLVYGKALSLHVPRLLVDGCPKRRARSQLVRVTLNFRAFAESNQALLCTIVEG